MDRISPPALRDRVLRAAALAALLAVGACLDPVRTPEAPPPAPASPVFAFLGQVPQFDLLDQEGERFVAGHPLGSVWVVSFVHTRSARLGALQTTKLSQAQFRLDSVPGGERVRLVTISTDPGFDSPETLYFYAQGARADTKVWSFLTGPCEEIGRIAHDGFGISSSASGEDGPMFECSDLFVVDSLGRVRGRFDGTTDDGVDRVLAALTAVLEEPHNFPSHPGVTDVAWMRERAREQRAALAASDVFHDFSFEDAIERSGITFRHRSTRDGAKLFRFSHYDHGNGVPSADVDGDGRYDLFFPTQAHGNEIWRNVGGGRFERIADAGVGLADRVTVTGSFADFDNDGDPDLYVTTVMGGNVLFANDGTGRFEDVTDGSGLGHVAHSSSPVFFDYDRDGLLDVFLTNVGVYTDPADIEPLETGVYGLTATYARGVGDPFSGHLKPQRTEPNRLFRNLGGGRFEDVSEAVGLVDDDWSGDATPLDANDDGWPDLYVLDMQGHDEYWENDGGKRFVRKGREVFPNTAWGAMGVKWFDFDGDEDFDLYITDMHSDMVEDVGPEKEKLKADASRWPESLLRSEGRSVFGNAFYLNDGAGGFSEVSGAVNAENYWPWGLTIADFNADGRPDAFLTSCMNFYFRYSANSLLLNDGGKRFLDAEFVLGVEPRRGGRTAKPWFALDGAGADADNPASKRFPNMKQFVIWDALGTRSSVAFDLDDDGDLDIVTNDFNSEPMVLISNLAERKPDLRYLKVALEGTKSNRDGLGARVTVVAGGRRHVQIHDGKSGYLSQSLLPLYFGLGGAATVERIEVRWPSGGTQVLEGPIATNELLRVVER